MDFKTEIKNVFLKNKIQLNEQQIILFEKYFNLLILWNDKINLTTITKQNEVIIKHFLDSCLTINLIKDNSKIIDIGAGAGFPSIPLKILNPTLEVVLIDSVNKKVNFINEVIKTLDLSNIKAFHYRAEDLAYKNEYRENFDYVVSRAVAALNVLCEYSIPFLKVGGILLAYKSIDYLNEINLAKNAITVLNSKVEDVLKLNIENNERNIIIIKKVGKTPKKYPRQKNKPRLLPL